LDRELSVRKCLAVFLSSAVLAAAGCGGPASAPAGLSDMSTASDLAEYLRDRDLPALEKVSVWDGPYGRGLKLSTGHYEIYTTLLEPLMLCEIPAFMESAYRGYNSQLPEPIETRTPLEVYLFAGRRQWEDFTRAFAGDQAGLYLKIKAGAYYLNGLCVAYNIGRKRTFSVLGHEGWHQFNSRHFKFRLPSWLDEGAAMLFETSRHHRGVFSFEPQRNLDRLGPLKKAVVENTLLPIRRLVSLNPSEVLLSGIDEDAARFYSQTYALVRFLREYDHGRYLAGYRRMLRDGLDGRWPVDPKIRATAADRNVPLTVRWNRYAGPVVFDRYFTGDADSLEGEYRSFCVNITYRVRLK
jgi:hypothetical protein